MITHYWAVAKTFGSNLSTLEIEVFPNLQAARDALAGMKPPTDDGNEYALLAVRDHGVDVQETYVVNHDEEPDQSAWPWPLLEDEA